MVCLSSLPFTGLNGSDPVARWYTVTPKLHKSTLKRAVFIYDRRK